MRIEKMVQRILRHYQSHDVKLKILKCETIKNGGERHIITVKPKAGTKIDPIFDRSSDIQAALRLPVFRPFREGLDICIAVAEHPITENRLDSMLKSSVFRRRGTKIPFALGYDLRGVMHLGDLGEFPHALIGGATKSGKSVALQNLIMSIAVNQPIDRVKLMIIDTCSRSLDMFYGLPNLYRPFVKENEIAVKDILTLHDEMMQRNALHKDDLQQQPYIVCIVDEFISLVSNLGEKAGAFTSTIQNLLRKGRHSKIHLVLATQEAAKQDMIIDQTNLNARLAFTCSNFYDSRAILGESGAEKLPGKGAMLFKSFEHPNPIYLQAAFMPEKEIEKVVARVVSPRNDISNRITISEMVTVQPVTPVSTTPEVTAPKLEPRTKEMADIIMWILRHNKISAKQIKEHFSIGNRVNVVLDELLRMELITGKFSNKPRDVIPSCYETLSPEVTDLLESCGYTTEQIIEAFDSRDDV